MKDLYAGGKRGGEKGREEEGGRGRKEGRKGGRTNLMLCVLRAVCGARCVVGSA